MVRQKLLVSRELSYDQLPSRHAWTRRSRVELRFSHVFFTLLYMTLHTGVLSVDITLQKRLGDFHHKILPSITTTDHIILEPWRLLTTRPRVAL